jgi:flagellar motor protein MotB
MQMNESIAKDYQVDVKSRDDGAYGISFGDDERADIVFHNDLNSQRITFSDYLLFARDDAKLKPDGEVVVRRVGARLNQQLAAIREIQIQGHADTRKTYNFPSNVELAYHRAVAVFDLLRNEVGIKPEEQLMSVTSFGEFLSVQRSAGDGSYTEEQLTTDNASDEMRQANRRIELVVIYRR